MFWQKTYSLSDGLIPAASVPVAAHGDAPRPAAQRLQIKHGWINAQGRWPPALFVSSSIPRKLIHVIHLGRFPDLLFGAGRLPGFPVAGVLPTLALRVTIRPLRGRAYSSGSVRDSHPVPFSAGPRRGWGLRHQNVGAKVRQFPQSAKCVAKSMELFFSAGKRCGCIRRNKQPRLVASGGTSQFAAPLPASILPRLLIHTSSSARIFLLPWAEIL